MKKITGGSSLLLVLTLFIAGFHAKAVAQSLYVSRNGLYANQMISGPTATQKKIGSFVIQNPTSDTILVTKLITGLASDSFKVLFGDLKIDQQSGAFENPLGDTFGSVPIANMTATNLYLFPGTATWIDIFANVNNASRMPTNFAMTLTVSATRFGTVHTPFSVDPTIGQTIRFQ